jgi:hypothetical protein
LSSTFLFTLDLDVNGLIESIECMRRCRCRRQLATCIEQQEEATFQRRGAIISKPLAKNIPD